MARALWAQAARPAGALVSGHGVPLSSCCDWGLAHPVAYLKMGPAVCRLPVE